MNERSTELDGLRGVAILLVLTYHVFEAANLRFIQPEALAFVSRISSVGWVGVDIFFVLSGFLITGILLKAKGKEHYFKNFYARRALRIFPLYYVFIIAAVVLIPVINSGFVPYLSVTTKFLLVYAQNWMPLFYPIITLPAYLGPTWSLAVEEQFYFLWPSVVYFVSQRRLLTIGVGIMLLIIAARLLALLFMKDTLMVTWFFYNNTFSRLEQFLFGGLLSIALTYSPLKDRIKSVAPYIFVGSVAAFSVLCIMAFPFLIPYRGSVLLTYGSYTLAGLFTSSMIGMLVTHPETGLIRRIFRNGVLSFFGKYSYSMYLLHVPVSLAILKPFMDTRYTGRKGFLIYVCLTYILTAIGALLTWNLLEKHMLNLKKYFDTK